MTSQQTDTCSQRQRLVRPSQRARGVGVVIAVVLSGCGTASPSTSARRPPLTGANPPAAVGEPRGALSALLAQQGKEPAPIKVATAARASGGTLLTRFTCHGADLTPPIRWARLPAAAREVVIFVDTLGQARPIINWAVAGLLPSRGGLKAGTLPGTAIVGVNSFGRTAYTLCPRPLNAPVVVSIVVIAVEKRLALHRGFDAAALLARLVKPGSHHGSVVMGYR